MTHQKYKKRKVSFLSKLLRFIRGENRWIKVDPRITKRFPGRPVEDSFALKR